MAECQWCGKSGWFTQVDYMGLCHECAHIGREIHRQCDQVIKCQEIIHRSKNLSTILSRIDQAQAICAELQQYHERGLPTLKPPPKEVITALEVSRYLAISNAARDAIAMARQKFKDAATDAGKLGGYARAIEKLTKLMDHIDDVSEIELAIERLREERDSLRATLLTRKADVWEAKGNRKKAIETLIEALMALRQDGTPDTKQADQLRALENRIADLGGDVPN